ncbi:MAG: hypothetical protein R3Y05_04115 [bacterium]
MICLNCKERIIQKRNILNLFSLKKEYICNNCYKQIIFEPNEILLPINNYDLRIYYLLKETQNFKYDSLTKENTIIFKKLKQTNYFVITINRYYMSDTNYNLLEALANHLQQNIIVLVYELFD